MEQQLQAEIKKNKNLLQSNFTLMEENEQCVAALMRLKKFFFPADDPDYEQTICAEDADSLVSSIIQKIEQERQANEAKKYEKTEQKTDKYKANNLNTVTESKQCRCQKWQDLYKKQSAQSYRLSMKIVDLEQHINKLQAKHELECKQMDNILKQYLLLFKKVNSSEFIQSQAHLNNKKGREKEMTRESTKQKQSKNQYSKTSREKQKEKQKKQERKSVSKSKNQSKSQHKKIKNNPQPDKNKDYKSIPQPVIDELVDFPNLTNYLENLRKDCSYYLEENKSLRKEISDIETLIRIYRGKERQRLIYGKFLIA